MTLAPTAPRQPGQVTGARPVVTLVQPIRATLVQFMSKIDQTQPVAGARPVASLVHILINMDRTRPVVTLVHILIHIDRARPVITISWLGSDRAPEV